MATQLAEAGIQQGSRPKSRWWALVFLALAQFMVVLDGTIVNLALPRLQIEMGISDSTRSWVVTAYALAFGAFLLLGGRIADFWGRKRTFIVAAVGFAVASLIGGIAQQPWELIGARALQGVFAALLAPAALALLTVAFPGGKDRGTAFAIFGSITGVGAAAGVLLGGFLTEHVSWRWCFFVNVPIAVIALAGVWSLVSESKAQGSTKYDWPGVVLAALGLGSLVYGFTNAEHGWDAPEAWGFIAAGAVLMVLFVVVETEGQAPPPAAARGHRAQPRRGLPGLVPVRRGPHRRHPVHQLLHPDRARLRTVPRRPRFAAHDGGGAHHGGARREEPAETGRKDPDGRGPGLPGGCDAVALPGQRRGQLPRQHAARAAAHGCRPGHGLRADAEPRPVRRGQG